MSSVDKFVGEIVKAKDVVAEMEMLLGNSQVRDILGLLDRYEKNIRSRFLDSIGRIMSTTLILRDLESFNNERLCRLLEELDAFQPMDISTEDYASMYERDFRFK